MESVHDEDLQGLCYVIHAHDTDAIDEWVKRDDHYYVNQYCYSSKPKSIDDLEDLPENDFRSCPKCHEEREDLMERESILLKRHGRLRGLELFSGRTLPAQHVLSLMLDYRSWWSWDRSSFIRLCRDTVGDRILAQRCANLQVG